MYFRFFNSVPNIWGPKRIRIHTQCSGNSGQRMSSMPTWNLRFDKKSNRFTTSYTLTWKLYSLNCAKHSFIWSIAQPPSSTKRTRLQSTWAVCIAVFHRKALSISLSLCWISFGKDSVLMFLFFLELKESTYPQFYVNFDILSLSNILPHILCSNIWYSLKDITKKAFQKLK